MQHRHTKQVKSAQPDLPHERWRLFGFAAVMLASGVGLGVVGGAPRLPDGAPRPEQLTAILSGSTLPAQLLSAVLLDLAWLMWAWIVGSLGLEVVVEAAEMLARGAVWARSLRRLADRVTFPLARRAVAAAFAVQILSRGVPVAAAQSISPAETAVIAEGDSRANSLAVAATPDGASEGAVASYVVRSGDTLWSIAHQAYGSGTAYRRLVDANTGRRMPDGQVFTPQGVIRPGWVLLVPEPSARIGEVDGQRWYTVGAGETLSAVAAQVLGDDTRWAELFELNRGLLSPDGQHTLTNPDVIWPGLRLRLPPEVVPIVQPAEPVLPDLVTASATSIVAPAASVEASVGPLDEQSRLLPPEAVDPLPLLRTLHVVEPIALEPFTDPDPAAASAGPGDLSPASAEEDAARMPPRLRDDALGPAALGGLGLVAIAGVALGARRMRRLRALPRQPESEVVVKGGFAEAQLAGDFTRGLHGVGFDPVAAIVDHVRRFLDEYDLGHVKLVALRHGRSATTLTLAGGLAEQSILVDLVRDFAARLDAEAEAWVSADQDVVYRLMRLRKTRLLPGVDAVADGPCLIPLGVLYDRQEYLATCSSLGHVLIASLPGHGADTILTSLVATLTAHRSPQQLRVWMIARPRALPAPVFDLPHLVRLIDPGDEASLVLALEDLRAEVDRRALHAPEADLVVVVPELTSLGEQATSFELLASRAAGVGVRIIAATSCPQQAMQSPLLGHFGTRMVLRMQDEEASVAMLGVADATFLGGGGRLLVRLDGREPVELYGYHVTPEHLERLVRVMRSAYPSQPSWPPEPAPPTPPPPAGGEVPVEAPAPRPEGSRIPAPAPRASVDPSSEPAARTADAAPGAASAANEPVACAAPVQADVNSARTAAPASPAVTAGAGASVAPSGDAVKPARADVAAAARPPIEVICFGGPRVLCAGQQVWPRRPGGEAKPWEFLLYLASQPAAGVASEDAVEALWPEDDEASDAPHRFRQLRYRLRHQLASVRGAPGTDGICLDRGTLRLDPALVYSDAQEFLGLVRSARTSPGLTAIPHLERARDLYQGDLLEGPDARRYGWVDERDDSGVTLREHFRRLFELASTRLAEMYAVSGKLDAAIDLYRDLTDVDPSDERFWCALFRLHADRGDRLALVREEHRMRACLRKLAAEIGDAGSSRIEDPSRETLQEYHRLLAGLQEPERAPAAV